MNAWAVGAGVVGAGALALGITAAVTTKDDGGPEGLSWGQTLSIAVPIGIGLGVVAGGVIAARSGASNIAFYGSLGETMGRYGAVGALAGAGVGGMVAGPWSAIA
jgi:hypothetical protein